MISEIKQLEDLIILNSQKYYSDAEDVIPDSEFDYYVTRLKVLDPINPILTKTGWGYQITSDSKKPHLYGEIVGIPDKLPPENLGNKLSKADTIFITPKLDGVSVVSYYENGRYVGSLTRGDGSYGENITLKIRDKVPSTVITVDGKPFTGMVRGEFIIKKSLWRMKYNSTKAARNYGSGLLNRKVISESELKDFEVVHYNAFDAYTEMDYVSQQTFLRKNNFNTNPYLIMTDKFERLTTRKSCEDILQSLTTDYECDGLVALIVSSTVNNRIAIKWNADGTPTTVLDIEWEQSRLGRFQPVVIIDPVDLSGATISRASAFNYEFIRTSNLGVGSDVLITRAGEVIPHIVSVLTPSEDNKVPTQCKHCNTDLVVSGVNLICDNPICPGKKESTLLYFVSKVVPVDGLGETILQKVFEANNIGSIIGLINFANRYVQNPANIQFELMRLFNSIKGLGASAHKKVTDMLTKLCGDLELEVIISGLGLESLSDKSVEKILEHFDSLESFQLAIQAPVNLPESIKGVTTPAYNTFISNCDYIYKIIEALPNVVFSIREPIEDADINMLQYNIGICVTGALSCSRREFLIECEKRGIQETTIAKADILVTNDTETSTTKNREAKKRGIPVMNEDDFRKKYFTSKPVEKEDQSG